MADQSARIMPLTWGQMDHWTAYRLAAPGEGWRNNMLARFAVPEGATADHVEVAVRRLVAAHDAFRTSYQPGESGEIVQVVHATFEPAIDVCDVTDEADPAGRADQFFRDLREREFVLEQAPPLRVGVAVWRGRPRQVGFVVNHIVLDYRAYDALGQQLDGLLAELAGGGPGMVEPPGYGPADEVDFEASPEGRRQHERALVYWTEVADEFPATTVPIQVGSLLPRDPMVARLVDRSGAEALAQLARQHRSLDSVMLLALFVATVHRLTGNHRTAVRIWSNNRFRSELISYIGGLYQTIPLVLSPPLDGSIAELIRHVHDRAAPVFRIARYDFYAVQGMLMRRQAERGINLETMVAYDYHSTLSQPSNPCDPAQAGVVFEQPAQRFTDQLGLVAHRAADALELTLRFNAAVLPAALAERFLAGLSGLLHAAATGGEPAIGDLLDGSGIPAPVDKGRWVLRDGCRVSLDEIEALLRSHPAVESCHVALEQAGGAAIVGYVAGAGVEPFGLRQHAVAHLKQLPATVAPDRFVVVASPPADPADPAEHGGWRAQPVIAAGAGREGPEFVVDTPLAAALADALAATNPSASWSGAASYLDAGGEVGRIDAFLAALHALGTTGLGYRDLYGWTSPRELVGKLRPAAQPPALPD